MAGSGRSPRKCSAEWPARSVVVLAALLLPAGGYADEKPALVPYGVVGDSVPTSLTGRPGDPERGRAIVLSRQTGLCLLCHSGPFPEDRTQGNLAPDLAGVASRLSVGQLRLRVIDAGRVNPATIMPPFYRTEGLARIAQAYVGKPILSAAQIEDVVAFLVTLKN